MRHGWLILLVGCSGMPRPPMPDLTLVREAELTRASSSDVLVRALDDRDLAPRAALAMGRIQSKAYLPALLKAIQAGHAAGPTAIWAAGQMAFGYDWRPGDGVPVVEALIPRASDGDPRVRLQVAAALGKMGGDKATAALAGLLKDSSVDVRVAAVDGFWRIHVLTKRKPDVAPLLALVSDAEEDVRWHLAYALVKLGEGKDALRKLVKDPNRWARLFAARGLADGSGLDDPEYVVRVEAARGAKELPESLRRDPSHFVRMEVAKHLPEVMLGDFSVDVRGEAVAGLPDPSPYLNDLDWRIRAKAASALKDVALLKRALTDPDRRVVLAAIESLGGLTDDASLELLSRLVAQGDVAVEWTAIESLGRRKQDAGTLGLRSEGPVTLAFEPLVDALEACKAEQQLLAVAQRTPPSAYTSYARRAYWRVTGKEAPASQAPVRSLPRSLPLPTGRVLVELQHEKGTMKLLLDADSAPLNVANVVALAKRGYYNGLEWHRVVPNFVIQGGDPRNDGWGDPGYRVQDEISMLPHTRGAVGISKMINDTGDSQLYITHVPAPHLDGRYTVIGYVIEGLEVLDRIERGDRILSARVVE